MSSHQDTSRESDMIGGFSPYEGHVSIVVHQASRGDFAPLRTLAVGWLMRDRIEPLLELVVLVGSQPNVSLAAFLREGVQAFLAEVEEATGQGRLRSDSLERAGLVVSEALRRLEQRSRKPEAWVGGITSPGCALEAVA